MLYGANGVVVTRVEVIRECQERETLQAGIDAAIDELNGQYDKMVSQFKRT